MNKKNIVIIILIIMIVIIIIPTNESENISISTPKLNFRKGPDFFLSEILWILRFPAIISSERFYLTITL